MIILIKKYCDKKSGMVRRDCLQSSQIKHLPLTTVKRLSYAPDINVKNALIDPVISTFEPQNSTTSRDPNMIPYTKFEHFGISHFYRASAH